MSLRFWCERAFVLVCPQTLKVLSEGDTIASRLSRGLLLLWALSNEESIALQMPETSSCSLQQVTGGVISDETTSEHWLV